MSLDFAPFYRRISAILRLYGTDEQQKGALRVLAVMVFKAREAGDLARFEMDGQVYRLDLKPIAKASGMSTSRVRKTLIEWVQRDFGVEANPK